MMVEMDACADTVIISTNSSARIRDPLVSRNHGYALSHIEVMDNHTVEAAYITLVSNKHSAMPISSKAVKRSPTRLRDVLVASVDSLVVSLIVSFAMICVSFDSLKVVV